MVGRRVASTAYSCYYCLALLIHRSGTVRASFATTSRPSSSSSGRRCPFGIHADAVAVAGAFARMGTENARQRVAASKSKMPCAFPRVVVAPSRSFFDASSTRRCSGLSSSASEPESESESEPDDDDDDDDIRALLHGKTLVSIRRCIAAFDGERRRRSRTVPETRKTPSSSPSSRVVFVDGSWYHKPDPSTGLFRIPSREYRRGPRLPDARYLDIDAVASTFELFPESNPKALPHMMPPPRLFALAMDAHDIRNDDHVIVYARRGALFAPRVWFLFVAMGHDPDRVHLMQGSLEDYVEGGGEVETHSLQPRTTTEGDDDRRPANVGEGYADCFDRGVLDVPRLHREHYSATLPEYDATASGAANICGKEEVLDEVERLVDGDDSAKPRSDAFKRTVILDTRGSGYAAKGHMPSAIHLPYGQIADPANPLAIRPRAALGRLFEERGVDPLDPELKIVLSCGSGVSVCHGYLALAELGREITEENTRIYDGSWKEWGKEDDLPKVLPGEK